MLAPAVWPAFETVATSSLEGLTPAGFDVVLANPPYYAQGSIAEMFVRRCRPLLRRGGRFYLVTKQPDIIAAHLVEHFWPGRGILAARLHGASEFCQLAQSASEPSLSLRAGKQGTIHAAFDRR